MRHINKILSSLVCFCWFCLLNTSCQENGDIGELYGQWQLVSFQHNSEVQHPVNAFLAFQNDCVFARITGTDYHFTYQLTGGFIHEGKMLRLSFYIDENKEGAEVIHQYMSTLFGFPLPHNDILFEIEQIDSSKLILINGDNQWHFRSY